jgi:transcriptional regulator with XRE-family HTH domain
MARRHAGLSQTELARQVGVQRSAVSHWEGNQARNPSTSNLRRVAEVTGVHFEWLATGRGPMSVAREVLLDSIEAAEGLFIEDPLEMRLIRAFRPATVSARLAMVELTECLSVPRRSPAK